jgi:hypothetical protein
MLPLDAATPHTVRINIKTSGKIHFLKFGIIGSFYKYFVIKMQIGCQIKRCCLLVICALYEVVFMHSAMQCASMMQSAYPIMTMRIKKQAVSESMQNAVQNA